MEKYKDMKYSIDKKIDKNNVLEIDIKLVLRTDSDKKFYIDWLSYLLEKNKNKENNFISGSII